MGTSVGLALKATAPEIPIMGHDPDASRVKRARKLRAVDKSHWNLLSACEGADLILLDLPLDEIEKTLSAVRDRIKDQVVIMDTAPVKCPVLDMAQRLLPEAAQFVGGHIVSPRLLERAEPSAELLKGATFYLVASESVSPKALAMVSNLAEAIGTNPHYIDAAEHDGIMAAVAQLPFLSALAIVNVIGQEEGRRDRAQCAGVELAAVDSILTGTPNASVEALLANTDNLVRWLDTYALGLSELRKLVADGDRVTLEQVLTRAVGTCEEWLSGGGESSSPAELEVVNWRHMFLGGLGQRRRRENP